MYTLLFYIKDGLETDEWMQYDFKVAKYFSTLEEAIQYVNNNNVDAVKDLISKGYSVGYSVVPSDKLDSNVEYSIITYAYKVGCVINHNLCFKYEIVNKEKS